MPHLGFPLSALPFAVLALALIVLAMVPALLRGDPVVRLGFVVIGACAWPWAGTTTANACVIEGEPSLALARAGFMPLPLVGSGLLMVMLGVAGRVDQHRRVVMGSFVLNTALMLLCGSTELVVRELQPTMWGLPYPRAGALYGLFVSAIPACVGYGVWATRNMSFDRAVHINSRRAIFGVGVLAVLAISDVFLTYGVVGVYPWSWLPSLIAVGLSLYAILHGDVLRSRGLDRGAVAETALIALAFGALVATLALTRRPAVVAAVCAGAAMLAVVVGRTIALADPAPRASQARELDRLVAELDLADDDPQIAAIAVDVLTSARLLDAARVAVIVDDKLVAVGARRDEPPLPPEIRSYLARVARPLTAVDLATERLGPLRPAMDAWLRAIATDVIVPLCERDQLVGVIYGRVVDDRALRDDDRATLRLIAQAIARAITIVGLHRAIDAQAALSREVALADAVRQARSSGGKRTIAGVEVAVSYQPAAQVAGDLWFAGALGDGRSVVMIGDVAGRGTSAALVSAAVVGACATVVGLAPPGITATAILAQLHAVVRGIDRGRHRVTAAVAIVAHGEAAQPGALAFAVAGHRGGYLVRNTEAGVELIALVGRSAPLGDPDWRAAETVHALAATDLVVVPSDGVVQARDGAGAAWGERRLQRILREAGPRGGLDLGDAALAAVRAHVGTAPLDDDLLIVTVAT